MAGLPERNFVAALTASVSHLDPLPTKEDVITKANVLAEVLGYDGSLDSAVEQAMISVNTRMGAGVSIVGYETPHDAEWVQKQGISWIYSAAYERLSDVTLRILGHLQNPIDPDMWDRRGLVIGHVQSGKTANYLGVVCRAADAGYKFIIIVAGIHNNLRSQTQERTDAGFVGRSSDPKGQKEIIGSGKLIDDFPHPITLTNTESDFSAKTAEVTGGQINDFKKPVVVVIKKNVSTLMALYKWLHDFNAKNGQIGDVPMLMIDDEADNASVDTSREDVSPTKTNFQLRRILSLFSKSCYVGYTATPFANIFINPDAYDPQVRDDLFPKDFIYSLDAPSSYFGPEKVFLQERSSARILRPRSSDETTGHELIGIRDIDKFGEGDPLPESLLQAIDAFFVAKAIRLARGQGNKHCSMLVNVSSRVLVQQSVRSEISRYTKLVREAVLANYALGDGVNGNYHMSRLHAAFEREYSLTSTVWDAVRKHLPDAIQAVKLFVINSKSDEVLNYRAYEKNGESLTALAIGGLSLSRGLTLEGLTISYMHRTTSTYDTLMQMGRWFGYRPGYEDLCRVYLPPQSIEWYAYIAEKSEDLRDQIRRMRRQGKTPKEFGLYMETHPDRLLITAANKMRHAQDVELERNLSGSLIETHRLPKSESINTFNETLIAEYWSNGFGKSLEESGKGWVVKDVEIDKVLEFLSKYDPGHGFMSIELRSAIDFLHEISDSFPEADVLLINGPVGDGNVPECRLGSQDRTVVSQDDVWKMPKDRVASRGDEKLGLLPDRLALANHYAQRDHDEDPQRSEKPSDKHYREARNKPLLMIHSIRIKDGDRYCRVPAVGVSFPYIDGAPTVKVKVNMVWLKQMRGTLDDNPEDEEDYDDQAPSLG
jgi:Z1 domain